MQLIYNCQSIELCRVTNICPFTCFPVHLFFFDAVDKKEVPTEFFLSSCSFVEGLAELVVQNSEDIVRLFEQGNRVRKMASVDKNSGGSR